MVRTKKWEYEDRAEGFGQDDLPSTSAACRSELEKIHSQAEGRSLTAEEQARFSALETHTRKLKNLEELAARGYTEHGSHGGYSDRRVAGNATRDVAMRHLDANVRTGLLAPEGAEKVEHLMGRGHVQNQTLTQRWAAATGDPHYATAFAKVVRDARGHLEFTSEEAAAWRAAREVRTAMSLSAGAGAELVPLTLDPSIILTNAGTLGAMRANSRVVTTSSGQWQGVSSAGATSEWLAEATEAADGSPALDDIPIPVHKAAVDVIWSYEVEQDSAGNFLAEVQRVANDAVLNMTELAYTTGSGVGEPTGLITALAGTTSEINGGGTEALDKDDPFLLQNALPARFSAGASFQSHIATANTFRTHESTAGSLYWPELRQNPPMLAGKPWFENNHIDGVLNTGATENNYLLIYGDFSNFVIVDQVGALFEILPGYGANRRPTAQRHGFLTFRTGSNVADGGTNPAAFRLLDVPTTA